MLSQDLTALDLLLRGAAAGLLVFQLINIWIAGIPKPQCWALTALIGSVLSYLLCSHPNYTEFVRWVRVPALTLCLMTAPILWLTTLTIFLDTFKWSAKIVAVLTLALGLGLLAANGIGGTATSVMHKVVMIGFIVASLWILLKDWRTDLVATRHSLRIWITGGWSIYILLVLVFELIFVGSNAPRWLEVLNLAGITTLTGLSAVACFQHPIRYWLGSEAYTETKINCTASRDTAHPNPSFVSLTPPPQAIDRKQALLGRVRSAMIETRAYAHTGLSLAQLAEQVETTPAQLREVINEFLGYRNFNDFLHHYRIDEATQRLALQDLPILSIALDVGYGSIGSFNRAFKSIHRITPSEYRSKVQKN